MAYIPLDALKLVVFDLAGTTVDHGCFGPLVPFVEAFRQSGIEITPADARGPMGLAKRDHLNALVELPTVRRQWQALRRRAMTEQDADAIYQAFLPRQLSAVADHCELAPSLLDCLTALRQRGLKVATTTGYFRAAAEVVYAAIRRQGFVPDASVCADDVPEGRPAPWMIFRAMEALRISPPPAVVKVGDTVPDIGEGLAAGCWSVGVTSTGSEVGCTADEFRALDKPERQRRLQAAREKLHSAGAHAVIDALDELPALIDELALRLHEGKLP